MCVSVTKVVIVNNGHTVRVFVFSSSHKIEWVGMVLRILNLEGHQSCMIMGESAGEGLGLLALVTG